MRSGEITRPPRPKSDATVCSTPLTTIDDGPASSVTAARVATPWRVDRIVRVWRRLRNWVTGSVRRTAAAVALDMATPSAERVASTPPGRTTIGPGHIVGGTTGFGVASGWTIIARRPIAARIPSVLNRIVSSASIENTSRDARAGRTSSGGSGRALGGSTPGSVGYGGESGFAGSGAGAGVS